MKKVYVLDTNVILTDPTSFESFEDNEVVIPFIVIEELEKHKTRSDEVGRNAREFSRSISKYIDAGQDIQKGIKLPRGGTVKALSSHDFQYRYNRPGEIDNKPDNVILSTAKDLTANVKNPVILVTQDLLLQIKANAIGVKVQTYKKNRVDVEASGLFIGHRTITEDITKEVIDHIHETVKEGDPIDFDIGENIHPNEFITLKDPDSKSSALLRYDGASQTFKLLPSATSVSKIQPKNREQRFAVDLLMDPDVKLVTLVGKAGCGKTLLSIAAGLQQVLDEKKYKKMVICRPIQPVGKDIGFLPGTKEEKLDPWIAPVKDNLSFLLGGSKKSVHAKQQSEATLEMLFDRGLIEVEAMTYVRGRSIANAFIIIDEAQNLSSHELKTIITRVGEGTKIVLTGDVEQIDTLSLDAFNNGLTIAVEKFKEYSISGHVTLVKGERSELASLAAKVL